MKLLQNNLSSFIFFLLHIAILKKRFKMVQEKIQIGMITKLAVGTNFITAHPSINLNWQKESFDIDLIEKELKLSASIGMNSSRVL